MANSLTTEGSLTRVVQFAKGKIPGKGIFTMNMLPYFSTVSICISALIHFRNSGNNIDIFRGQSIGSGNSVLVLLAVDLLRNGHGKKYCYSRSQH